MIIIIFRTQHHHNFSENIPPAIVEIRSSSFTLLFYPQDREAEEGRGGPDGEQHGRPSRPPAPEPRQRSRRHLR